jgi:8-oxo-dGTP pyrophosphatase MutT (NUDIX family)
LDPLDRAHRAAALRETFEEAGLWLGPTPPPPEARAPLARGEVGLAALLDQGARADLGRLTPFARWQTPVAEPKRFDTRFYLVEVEDAPEVTPDGAETVEARWVRPEEAAAATLRAFPVAPPTWWTLTQLAQGALPEVEDPRPVLPILRFEQESTWLVMPGHPEHPDPGLPGWPTRIAFEGGRWVAYAAP